MPFVKLDCGIVNSSLWIERDVRSVFITALVMAELREFREPIPQISVRSLELTGWIAPPGWYGFVAAAGTGIVRKDGIDDTDAGLDALEKLGSPDADSRSKAHGGRRMIRVDGGYVILNYAEYREHDYGSADRVRRYRQRQKDKRAAEQGQSKSEDVTRNGNGVTRNSNGQLRNVTHADADADADADAEKEKDLTTSSHAPAALDAQNDPDFMRMWALYPKRAGTDSRKRAYRAWNARLRAGISVAQLTLGASRYAAYCKATQKVGTEFVMMCATFFGPNDNWAGVYAIPKDMAELDFIAAARQVEEEDRRHV